ncbi:hypothetical protein J2Y55_002157 [Bosea sp. BE125]|nr:hypothetical protein [Bosea sp. BE125]
MSLSKLTSALVAASAELRTRRDKINALKAAFITFAGIGAWIYGRSLHHDALKELQKLRP